jgi:hypothetical protein
MAPEFDSAQYERPCRLDATDEFRDDIDIGRFDNRHRVGEKTHAGKVHRPRAAKVAGSCTCDLQTTSGSRCDELRITGQYRLGATANRAKPQEPDPDWCEISHDQPAA